MDSLRLIYFRPRNPSWIWIRYVQHASHKHHKIYYVDPSATPLSTQNYTVTLNTSLTRLMTRCHFQHPAKPFRLKHPTSLNTTSLAAPRTNRLKAANKNFRCCVLLKNSLVIHICCLKKYSAKQITFSPHLCCLQNRYTLLLHNY